MFEEKIKEAERVDNSFEREKWLVDVEIRRREIALKEREAARARWSNPLALAVLAAAVAAAGNAGVAWMNGQAQREIELIKTQQTILLEDRKAEASRILEVLRTNDPDKSAANLKFLLNVGLITDRGRSLALEHFLQNRAPGQGPTLPDACQLYPAMCK